MILRLPTTFAMEGLKWMLEERENGSEFKNEAEAIEFLQANGLSDYDIGQLLR